MSRPAVEWRSLSAPETGDILPPPIPAVEARPSTTGAWMAQQRLEAFTEETTVRWRLHDRDRIYDDRLRRCIASTDVVSSPLSPWQNPFGASVWTT